MKNVLNELFVSKVSADSEDQSIQWNENKVSSAIF